MDRIKSFEYVVAIAETGSISEVADSFGIAQSALSRHIINLEKEIGIELFDRTTLPILPTEAGQYYVETGHKILDLKYQLEKRIEDLRTHKNMEIRVGTGPSRAPALMPIILKEFSSLNPNVRVLTDECRTAELAERLINGKLDLIITFMDHSTDGFSLEELFEEKVELAVHNVYVPQVKEKLENGSVDISRLSIPFVSLHKGQQLRNALEILTKGTAKPLYTCDYQESTMALVKHGFGATLVPSYWKLIDNSSDILYFPIIIPTDLSLTEKNRLMAIINRRIGIFYRKEQFLSDAEKAYISAAKKVCAEIH